MTDKTIDNHSIHHDDDTDSFASTDYEFFSGALASELGIKNAIIIRKLEIIDNNEFTLTSKKIQSCIPDNVPDKVLYNYVWKPLNDSLSKSLYYMSTVSLVEHLRQLCQEHYLYCKHIKGLTWYSINYSKLNRLYDISKYTN